MKAGAPLNAERIRRELNVHRIGRQVRALADAASTNQLCLDAADESNDGLVIFAEHQSAGRGRMGRTWSAPRGSSLLFSVLLIEPAGIVRPDRWSLKAGVAAAEAVRAETDVEALLKWPNDVVVLRGGRARKLGGVLIETRRLPGARKQAWVIGVGLNCLQHAGHFPPELGDAATSLEIETAGPVDRQSLACRILQQLDAEWSRADDDADLRERWLQLALPILGRQVVLEAEGRRWRGTVVDVEPAEGLILQLADGGRRAFGLQTSWVESHGSCDASQTA
jgi:BirA family biotin operon repressor/biotin-[acetyl-CoA-carboxylase] ligase